MKMCLCLQKKWLPNAVLHSHTPRRQDASGEGLPKTTRGMMFIKCWMSLQLLLGHVLTLLAVHPSSSSRLVALREDICPLFFPPLPPPLFPPLQHRQEVMVDITELITGPQGEKGCRGPQGSKGESGMMGPQGEKGQSGAIGKPGHKGEKGFQGWRGLKGAPGSACVLKGNKGPAGLRGGQGLKGDPGPSGDPAHPGVPGTPGHKGDPGLCGGPGVEGVQGPRGEPGLRGTKGLKGLRGPSGPLGHLGAVGAPGLTGQPGLPGQVFHLEGLQGEPGSPGPLSSSCSCSPHPRIQPRPHRVQKIFIADGEEALRKLQKENTMVLRTDMKALYIFTEQQWINVLNPNSDSPLH
ncbi:acetylcholinesterase collagenic tail peptide-like [Nerophis ophidion]|uniref:acetylcholinesterase collagenic tail peptide-like n=1 Tax=Nerophis ophidion TaxID=159077 RepID=UPI002ADFF830|nr:acetylcholinesterase collagenic tail peptide-like [Nerophis ophidion]